MLFSAYPSNFCHNYLCEATEIQGEFIFTSLWPFSAQLNQRMKEGRIQEEDQEKGQMSGQSMSGSAKERSENLCGKVRRYQGNWMGISMIRFQRTDETDD